MDVLTFLQQPVERIQTYQALLKVSQPITLSQRAIVQDVEAPRPAIKWECGYFNPVNVPKSITHIVVSPSQCVEMPLM